MSEKKSKVQGSLNEKLPLGDNGHPAPAYGQHVPPGYMGPPPAYSAAPLPHTAATQAGPGVTTFTSYQYQDSTGVRQQYAGVTPAQYGNYAPPPYNHGYQTFQGVCYNMPPAAVVQFDSGATLNGAAAPVIPPPPPGYAPNAAQLAAAHGGTVYVTQKKAGWFSGNGGGVSLW